MKITIDNLPVIALAQGCRLKPGKGHVTIIRRTIATVDLWEDGELFLRTASGTPQPLTLVAAVMLLRLECVSS